MTGMGLPKNRSGAKLRNRGGIGGDTTQVIAGLSRDG